LIQATEEIARQYAAAARNRDIWKNVIYNVKDYRAKGDGTTDDTAAITNAIVAARGAATLYFPPGDYLISSEVAITFSDYISIWMDPKARVFTTKGFASKMFQFLHGEDYGYPSFRWSGGILDAGNVYSSVGGSTDSLWIQGGNGVLVENVTFLFGPDYSTPAGDGFSLVNCRNSNVSKCWFYGAPDSAIYITGDSDEAALTDDGYDTIIEGCHFEKCQTGVTSKRLNKGMVVIGNTFRYCQTGVISLEADGIAPGLGWVIANNTFKFTEQKAIEIRMADGAIVTGNRIEDFSYSLDDTLFTGFTRGISIEGSKRCVISGNWIGFKDWSPPATNTRGIFLSTYSFEGVDYNATQNLIEGNTIQDVQLGIHEETASDGENTIGVNVLYNCTTPITVKSSSSVYYSRKTSSPAHVWGVGTSDILEISANGVKIKSTAEVKGFLSGSFTVDFGSIPANSNLEQDVTLTGALTGDIAIVNPQQAYSGGLEFFARVSAADTVKIRVRNFTGAAIDPPPLTLKVVLIRI
jgi:hypothetical protein